MRRPSRRPRSGAPAARRWQRTGHERRARPAGRTAPHLAAAVEVAGHAESVARQEGCRGADGVEALHREESERVFFLFFVAFPSVQHLSRPGSRRTGASRRGQVALLSCRVPSSLASKQQQPSDTAGPSFSASTTGSAGRHTETAHGSRAAGCRGRASRHTGAARGCRAAGCRGRAQPLRWWLWFT